MSVRSKRWSVPVVAVLMAGLMSPVVSAGLDAKRAAAVGLPFIAQVNFQSQFALVPTGYVEDYGLGYTASGRVRLGAAGDVDAGVDGGERQGS